MLLITNQGDRHPLTFRSEQDQKKSQIKFCKQCGECLKNFFLLDSYFPFIRLVKKENSFRRYLYFLEFICKRSSYDQ